MANRGKLIGVILLAVGIVIMLLLIAWLGSGVAEGKLSASGLVLGIILGLIIVLPLVGGGVFLIVKGRGEARQLALLEKEKQLLGMISSQGQVSLGEAALELNISRSDLKQMIYDLVNKELFTGYINWDAGNLYAKEASEMRGNKCPHCGGQLELAGKGVVHCPYCGAEIFL